MSTTDAAEITQLGALVRVSGADPTDCPAYWWIRGNLSFKSCSKLSSNGQYTNVMRSARHFKGGGHEYEYCL